MILRRLLHLLLPQVPNPRLGRPIRPSGARGVRGGQRAESAAASHGALGLLARQGGERWYRYGRLIKKNWKPCYCWWEEVRSFSRMRSEGFSFNFGSLRVELCSPVVVFVFATVRNRSQVFESGSYGPAVGESSKKWLFMDVSRVSLRRYSIVICIKVVCHARKVMHFAAQAQGFVKVTRLHRSHIRICSFRVVF